MSRSEPDVEASLIADVFARDCRSRDLLADVAGKWSVLALLALDEGGYRFNALRRRVQGVSEKMLAQTLQTLERDGLVAREVVSTIPPRVEYALTPLGARVARRVRGLVELLEEAVPEVVAARAAYDGRRAPATNGTVVGT
jgi:DNA-binding HxlR family transcriptional regulator